MLAATDLACRQLIYVFVTLFAFVGVVFFHSSLPSDLLEITTKTAANATLGFGKVYVVSGPDSPRRAHLEQAAAITGLELTIPKQKAWTDAEVQKFRPSSTNETQVHSGSAKAWLAHHVVLHSFLASDAETALILEDDVDWDIRLRTTQISLAQRAVRNLTSSSGSLSKNTSISNSHPWSDPSLWDVLYLGHCGDYWVEVGSIHGPGFLKPSDLTSIPHTTYHDPSMLETSNLHPFTTWQLNSFNLPNQTRIVHPSKSPLCTFGYAVTREAAQRILIDIAPAHEETNADSIVAYDVALMAACCDSSQLRCYTLTPEVFHHKLGDSLIAQLEASQREIFLPPVDAVGEQQALVRGETSNIGCGFWSGHFYYDEEPGRLPFLRKEVGIKNRCLKPGRYRPGRGG